MNTKQVKVESLRPGDPIVYRDNRILYIKNIYDGSNDVSSTVISYYGPCVVLEFTDNKEKCSKNYTKPEYISVKDLDYSVKDLITVPLII